MYLLDETLISLFGYQYSRRKWIIHIDSFEPIPYTSGRIFSVKRIVATYLASFKKAQFYSRKLDFKVSLRYDIRCL